MNGTAPMDFGERNRAGESLEAREREFGPIINAIPALAWSARPDGSADFFNQHYITYVGLPLEQLEGSGWAVAVHPDDLTALAAAWRLMMSSGKAGEAEARLRRFDGEYRWFLFRASPMRDGSGSIVKWVGINTDIEDHKCAQEALAANERGLRSIVNTIPTTAWTTRPDGYCDFINQRWLDYAGMTAEQAVGWGWAAAIHPADRKGLVECWQSCLASGTPLDTEARLRRYDSAYRWFLFLANPLRDELGKVVKWYGTNVDIEDRKRVEEGLRASELSWRQTVDNIPGFVLVTGAMGKVEFLNRQILEYFGKTSEDLKNWDVIDVVHPDDIPRSIEARKKSIEGGQPYELEVRCRRADGVYRWFQVRGVPVLDEENKITARYLLLTDIEDRKRGEEALQSNERNLNLILNTIPTHIYVLNAEGSVQGVNQAVMDYTGLTLDDMQQEDYRDRVIHPEDFKRVRPERAASLRRGAPFSTEQRVLGNDGQYRWFLVRYKPLLDEQGHIIRWYVAAFDIEDRKRAEARVEQAYLRLSEAQRLSKTGSFITDLLADDHDWSEETFRIFECKAALPF